MALQPVIRCQRLRNNSTSTGTFNGLFKTGSGGNSVNVNITGASGDRVTFSYEMEYEKFTFLS